MAFIHCAGGAGGGLLLGGTTTPGLPMGAPPCDGVPGVPGWGPEPQLALGGTGPPAAPSDRPEGGRLSMDLCAALLLVVRLQQHELVSQLDTLAIRVCADNVCNKCKLLDRWPLFHA